MKKIVLFLTAFFAFICVAQAQITVGEPYSTKVKTGNRPQAGDWGLYIGPSYSEVLSLIDWANKKKAVDMVRGLPLINVKYYMSDNLEIRGGIQYFNVVEKYKGTTLASSSINNKSEDFFEKHSDALFRFIPGVAYHFNSKNIMDVYVGGQLPLGCDIDKQEIGNYYINNQSRTPFVIGIGAFVGLQAFVADLPFSIGLEYGLSGLWKIGDKIKNEVKNGNNSTQTFYTKVDNTDPTQFEKLNCHRFEVGNDLRLTFTYYFNNK